jgi:hypothetical protein
MTAGTLFFVPHDFGPDQLAFRIGTPFAAQRASFQEDNGADSRTVIDRKLLNVEYNAFVFHVGSPHIHRINIIMVSVNEKLTNER